MCTHTKRQAQRDRHRDDLRLDDSGWRWSPEPSLILIKRLHDNQYHNISNSLAWYRFVFFLFFVFWNTFANLNGKHWTLFSWKHLMLLISIYIDTTGKYTQFSHIYFFFFRVSLLLWRHSRGRTCIFKCFRSLCVVYWERDYFRVSISMLSLFWLLLFIRLHLKCAQIVYFPLHVVGFLFNIFLID